MALSLRDDFVEGQPLLALAFKNVASITKRKSINLYNEKRGYFVTRKSVSVYFTSKQNLEAMSLYLHTLLWSPKGESRLFVLGVGPALPVPESRLLGVALLEQHPGDISYQGEGRGSMCFSRQMAEPREVFYSFNLKEDKIPSNQRDKKLN